MFVIIIIQHLTESHRRSSETLKHPDTLHFCWICLNWTQSYSAKAHKNTINPSHWPHETGLGITEEFTEDAREDEGEGNGN